MISREHLNKKVFKSFATHEKAKYWSKKNVLRPEDVAMSTNKKFYFDCDCGHEIIMSLNGISAGKWCSYCNSYKLCENDDCMSCFNKSLASHPAALRWNEKNECKPRDICKGSNKKYYFDCIKCKHILNVSAVSITKGNDCAYCNGKNMCYDNQCQHCFNRSFASHEKAQFYSDSNPKTAREMFKSSNYKCSFNCPECLHIFSSQLNDIISGNWCPFCVSITLCDDLNCNHCFQRSFASHPKAIFWNKNNEVLPRNMFKCSDKSFIFDCNKCNHVFKALLSHVSSDKAWCPFCIHSQLCDDYNCLSCMNNSFASCEKSKFWSKKNQVSPRMCFLNSHTKYIFDCPLCENELCNAIKKYDVVTNIFIGACYDETWKI